ncbi:MAG TPA: hypothetical protein DEB10_12140, partial [Ruminococcaceae bacterium]|nr:hypothetical protein [Oscillospiraceae bacterium]
MLIKYRVNEVAKDFGKTSKEVINLLAKYLDEPKKSMTALEENELDLVFEHFTQESAVENFDEYFATASAPKEKKQAKAEAVPAEGEVSKAASPGKKTNPAAKMPASAATPVGKSAPTGQQREKQKQPVPPKPPAERRMVDTRTPQNIAISKYDEKFDVLAQTSNRVQGDGGAIKKKKLNQRYQQYRRPRGKHETEAERLKRIQAERKSKPIKIT